MQTLSTELTEFTRDISMIEQNGELIKERVGHFEIVSNDVVISMKNVADSLKHLTAQQCESEQLINATHSRAQSII